MSVAQNHGTTHVTGVETSRRTHTVHSVAAQRTTHIVRGHIIVSVHLVVVVDPLCLTNETLLCPCLLQQTAMVDQHAFVLAGPVGCGKSTAAEHIVTELTEGRDEDATSTEVSDFVRALFNAEHSDEVDDNELGRWAADKKDAHGNGYFVRAMAELWRDDSNPHVVISGVRSPEEATAVRDVFGSANTTVISIWTLPDVRFERRYGEIPSEEHPEWETFQERNEREIHEWNCLDFYVDENLYDYILTNNGTAAALRIDVAAIIDHDVFGDEMPVEWNDDYYPFPERDRDVVAQYV